MKSRTFIFLAVFSLIAFISCKKDTKTQPPADVPQNGSVKIVFENKVDTSALILNTKNYVTQNGDTFKVNYFKYYISNIKLIKSDNTVFAEDNSYHLLDHSKPTSLILNIANIPAGSYNKMQFMIGVDSMRCCSGAQMGDLDPAKGMFWDWDSGYIMAYLGGSSPQSTGSNNSISFQSIGFKGVNNVIRYADLSFGSSAAAIASDHTPSININCNVAEWFKNPTMIKFSTFNLVGDVGPNAKLIADNYADMFSFKNVSN